MASQTENALRRNDDVELEVEEEEEDELEKLKAEVSEMAHKLINYRATLPDQLKSQLGSILIAQRPVFQTHFSSGSQSQPGPPSHPPISGNEASLAGDDEDNEKTRLVKQKLSDNASAMPILLKRMKDSMARIDQLGSCNENIHPAFERKRTS